MDNTIIDQFIKSLSATHKNELFNKILNNTKPYDPELYESDVYEHIIKLSQLEQLKLLENLFTKSEPTDAPIEPVKAEPVVPVKSEPIVPVKSEPIVPVKSEPVVLVKSEPIVPVKSEPIKSAVPFILETSDLEAKDWINITKILKKIVKINSYDRRIIQENYLKSIEMQYEERRKGIVLVATSVKNNALNYLPIIDTYFNRVCTKIGCPNHNADSYRELSKDLEELFRHTNAINDHGTFDITSFFY